MRVLSIDIETYSSVSIKAGVYKYVESGDFTILLFAYAYGEEEVTVVDLTGASETPNDLFSEPEVAHYLLR